MAGSLAALIVMLVLPALRTHHFSTFYRASEVRQTAARHCSVNLTEDATDIGLDRFASIPALTHSRAPELRIVKRPFRDVYTSSIGLSCLLGRLKFGARRSSDPPPLA